MSRSVLHHLVFRDPHAGLEAAWLSLGAAPVNFGFACACVLQDAPDGGFFYYWGFFFGKGKSSIYLMVRFESVADFLGLVVLLPCQNPRKTFFS